MTMIDVLRAKAEIAAAQLKLKQAELAVLLGAGKEPEPEPEPAPCAWLGQARYGTERQAERSRERRAQLAEDHRDWIAGGKGTGMPEAQSFRYGHDAGGAGKWFGDADR